jgi:hypothetical protein
MAWQLFSEINRPGGNGTRDVTWETWADDSYQFPPAPNPLFPPTWPEPRLTKTLRNESPTLELAMQGTVHLPTADIHALVAATQPNEEVRRNKPTFDYILANHLWYAEGIAAFTKAGRDVQAPQGSIMVKARWKLISEADKPRYHWNLAVDPADNKVKPFGLIALHVTAKNFPNWLWATFEQVDNPDRGAVLGYHDSFGVDPPNSNGKVSEALRELFSGSGLGSEWLNYRLDGTQVDFRDGSGQDTLLGNSEIEGQLGPAAMESSSCMSCHARIGASIATGAQTGAVAFVTGPPPLTLYYGPDGKKTNIQLDFIWGLALAHNAFPLAPVPAVSRSTSSPRTLEAR